MSLEWLRHPAATFLLGAASIAGLWLLNPPEAKVITKEVEVVRTVEVEKKVVEYVDREVVKFKTKTVYRDNGTVASVETCELQQKESSESTSAEVSKETESTTERVYTGPALSRYSLGTQANWKAAVDWTDLSYYRLTAGARIGNLPVFGEAWVSPDLEFGIGIRFEF